MLLIVAMLTLCVLGFPVALSMLLSGCVFLIVSSGNFDMLHMVPIKMVSALNNFSFMALPLFMLAGELMNSSKITDEIFSFALKLVGKAKGGLAYVNVLASVLFAAMSGSAIAHASGLGKMLIVSMREKGYDASFAASVTAASACMGPVIPPSTMMVIAALVTDQSVGRLLLGGAIPGLLMGIGIMSVCAILSHVRNYPSTPWEGWKAVWTSFKGAFPPLMTPVILIGGIFIGVFTPTEASVVTCVYAMLLGFGMKSLNLKKVYHIFCEVGVISGGICILIASAQVIGFITVQEMIPQQVAEGMLELTDNPYIFMLISIGLFLFLGCFIGDLTLLVILGPILMPTVLDLSIDPVQFVVLMVLVLQLGMITPPVGVVMYICNEWAEISILEFARAIIPFIIALAVVSAIIVFFPQTVVWLPNLVF